MGMGGLGCPCSMYLAAAGIGKKCYLTHQYMVKRTNIRSLCFRRTIFIHIQILLDNNLFNV